jgi:hypothetical protein
MEAVMGRIESNFTARRGPIRARIRVAAGVVIGSLSISGCAAPATNGKASTVASPEPASSPSHPSIAAKAPAQNATSPLAEQARRDVEALLRLPGEGTPRADGAARSEAAAGTSHAPEIEWNDMSGARATQAPGARVSAAPTDVRQPPGQSPLFRDLQPPPLIEPAPGAEAEPSTSAALDQLTPLLVDLARELNLRAADTDMPLRELLAIAATTLVDPDRSLNPEAFPDLSERERELLKVMQVFFADLGRDLAASGDAEVIPAAVERLRAALNETRLRLANAALCYAVEGFGRYSAFEPSKFLAHSDQRVIVYVEIAEFTSEVNAQGEYVTELAQQLVIYSDRDGIPVWQEDWQTAIDRTKNRRSDFFLRQIITLPPALSVGPYQLKVRVRDHKSGAQAETSIPFEMVADPRLAATIK